VGGGDLFGFTSPLKISVLDHTFLLILAFETPSLWEFPITNMAKDIQQVLVIIKDVHIILSP